MEKTLNKNMIGKGRLLLPLQFTWNVSGGTTWNYCFNPTCISIQLKEYDYAFPLRTRKNTSKLSRPTGASVPCSLVNDDHVSSSPIPAMSNSHQDISSQITYLPASSCLQVGTLIYNTKPKGNILILAHLLRNVNWR